MTLKECQDLYQILIKKYDCDSKLGFLKRVKKFRCAGRYYYNKNEIKLQPTFVELNKIEVVTNVLLHEIAHALVPPRSGHNFIWKRKALSIGCNGRRCYGKEVIRKAEELSRFSAKRILKRIFGIPNK